MLKLDGSIDGEPLLNCPRCKGTGKPHKTDHPMIKKCMCILHYYVCPKIISVGDEDIHKITLDGCDCKDKMKLIN